jgi:hypothetical protein
VRNREEKGRRADSALVAAPVQGAAASKSKPRSGGAEGRERAARGTGKSEGYYGQEGKR